LFKFENVFNLFTEMPLHGFAYKIVILIPIWPVQLGLGS
jgi:hypothetical protein